MSLYEMTEQEVNDLPTEHLENTTTNYVIAAFQAADWEPTGRTKVGQVLSRGTRSVLVSVTVLDEVHRG